MVVAGVVLTAVLLFLPGLRASTTRVPWDQTEPDQPTQGPEVTTSKASPDPPETNEGTTFMVALPPCVPNTDHELIIHTRQDTTVVFRYPSLITDFVVVTADVPARYILERVLRTTDGIEDLGIVIEASDPVTIHFASTALSGPRIPETTLLRPAYDGDLEFYLASYSPSSESTSSHPKSFYMIVPRDDLTFITVYLTDGSIDAAFTLNRNQVYTWDALHNDGDYQNSDVTGYRITATSAVAVYAGNGGALSPPEQGGAARYMFESMPKPSQLGTSYITFPLHYGHRGVGYHVRVISVRDGTQIDVPGMSYSGVHDSGNHYAFDWVYSQQGTTVTCSQPCLVAEYAKAANAGDSPGQQFVRPFMVVLNPMDQFVNETTFSMPAFADDAAITQMALAIVTDHLPTNLYLDGVNLDYLDWSASPDFSGFFATVGISAGTHEMHTLSPSERFTAYVHGSSEFQDTLSFGFVTAYGGGEGYDSHASETSERQMEVGFWGKLWQKVKNIFN